MDERVAIACARRGEMAGLAWLAAAHQVRAVRTAYLIVCDRPLAEDIVQQALIRAYERIGQLEPGRPFAPWFLRSVANDALKAVTRGQRTVSLDDAEAGRTALAELLANPTGGPEQALEAAERAEAIWSAVQELPPEQRTAIVLRYYAGLSDAEIAAQTDTPPPTVRWRLHAARRRLRAWLEG